MGRNQIIRNLADRLVARHLFLSGLDDTAHVAPQLDQKTTVDNHRVIVVVGAGASAGAKLPLAAKVVGDLRRDLNIGDDEFEKELKRLSLVFRLDRESFETKLLAMGTSVTRVSRLRRLLGETYGSTMKPLLVYEIVAHLLKHRFVDAVINFNFDELLDHSVRDEVGPNGFHYLVSDGDCPGLSPSDDGRLNLPLYIKPHGTVSRRSTLRFTREHYFHVPEEIQSRISEMLNDGPTTLVVAGFAMGSFEFNELLRSAEAPVELVYIDCTDRERAIAHSIPRLKYRWVQVDDTCDLDKTFRGLWEEVMARFTDAFKPRDITRHEFVSTLFRDVKPRERTNYCHDRSMIELALAISKGKGVLDITQLSTSRFGHYYDLVPPSRRDPIRECCKKVGLNEVGYAHEIMRLQAEDESIDSGRHPIVQRCEFEQAVDGLLERLLRPGVLRTQSVKAALRAGEDMTKTLFMKHYDGDEVEIDARPNRSELAVYTAPKQLPTMTALREATGRLFAVLRRNHLLLIVAETGEWLLKRDDLINQIRSKEIDCYMVLADEAHLENLQTRLGDRLRDTRQIPYWTHNRHMTIVCSEGYAHRALYFKRPLRALSISPVELEGEDAGSALKVFYAYWDKARWLRQRKELQREVLTDPAAMLSAIRGVSRSKRGTSTKKKRSKSRTRRSFIRAE